MVDAFDVMAPGTRFQENHPALAYSGDWFHGNVNRTWSEGSASTSATAGARAGRAVKVEARLGRALPRLADALLGAA